MRGCRRVRRWIAQGLDGGLSLEKSFALDEHLAGCERCARYRAQALGLEEALQGLPEAPLDRLDLERVTRSVRAAIAFEESSEEPTRSWRGIALVAAVLLGLVTAGALFFVEGRGGDAAPALSPRDQPIAAAPRDTLADVRQQVRAALVQAAADDDELLGRFDAAERLLSRKGHWPVIRIAEELLADDDEAVACAAARVLGRRGDRISAVALRQALAREPVAVSALDALAALGESGVGPLEEALMEERLAERALEALAGVGGRVAAEAIENAIRGRGLGAPYRNRRGLPRERLLDGLVRCGPAALESFLRLAERARVRDGYPADVLARLELVSGADTALEELMALPHSHPTGLLLAAAVRLQPDGLLPWIEDLCLDRNHRDQAFDALVRWDTPGALESMLRLWSDGRVPLQVLREPAIELVVRGPERAAELARSHARSGRQEEAHALLDFLIACEVAEAAPALAALASSKHLAEDDRQWAALAVGELGCAADAELLAEELAHINPSRQRLVAAFLISIHDLTGEAGVNRALGRRSARRLLDALQHASERRGAVHLHRVARELAPLFPEIVRAPEGSI